jgi:cold shock CspA family protein
MAGGSVKQKGKLFGFIQMGGKGLFFYATSVQAIDFSRLYEGQKVVLHGGGHERLGGREHHADIAGPGVSA